MESSLRQAERRAESEVHREGRPESTPSSLWGAAFVLVLALGAQFIGARLPLLGGAITGLVLGILIRQFFGLPNLLAPGVRLVSSRALKLAIVLLGAGMSFEQVWQTGSEAIVVILATVLVGMGAAVLLGRWLNVSRDLSQLIGVGTSICGATAIATVAPIIRSREEDTAYAVSTIFTFNLIAVFLYPLVGHLLGLNDSAFGTWAGTAIQDTSSVVAAGFAYGDEAGAVATVVKLTRTLFLLPMALLFGVAGVVRGEGGGGRGLGSSLLRAFPLFLLGFLGLALIRNTGLVPLGLLDETHRLGKFLVVAALVSIGLGSDLARMKVAGFKPLLLGLAASFTVGVLSLVLIELLG